LKFLFCVYCTDILRKFDDMIEVILPQLPTSFDTVTDPEGKAALLWILGEYGESLPNTPYVLEELVNNVADEASSEVKLQLLTAVMKMFMKRPPECQDMLGRLLEHAIGTTHIATRVCSAPFALQCGM
jgi:AP-4 complex subunit beta-1